MGTVRLKGVNFEPDTKWSEIDPGSGQNNIVIGHFQVWPVARHMSGPGWVIFPEPDQFYMCKKRVITKCLTNSLTEAENKQPNKTKE